jgi:hypothetical protein
VPEGEKARESEKLREEVTALRDRLRALEDRLEQRKTDAP